MSKVQSRSLSAIHLILIVLAAGISIGLFYWFMRDKKKGNTEPETKKVGKSRVSKESVRDWARRDGWNGVVL